MISSHQQTLLSPPFDTVSHDLELTYLAEVAGSQGDVLQCREIPFTENYSPKLCWEALQDQSSTCRILQRFSLSD